MSESHHHTGRLRCAVYTRKSSEEGLEQAFNSLDAQREAGLDYIRSQRHQGWVAVHGPSSGYDDGGYSGGSTDRPALQRLLADIAAGRIDVVVVYKVDRLSRSLADFARLMQDFDARGVSFVSVTQQFNTTTSMGRLTLNMLLSFAQFEREVAGERIRDKIAATMRRGVWICGKPPLGYRRGTKGEEPGLHVIREEADLVRDIFRGYARLGSPVTLARELNAAGHTSKRWTARGGRVHGGMPFTAGSLYKILTNPLYIGKLTHTRRVSARGEARTEIYDGVHEPIIARDLWDRVHAIMERKKKEPRARWTHTHLLKGKLRTFQDATMTPTTARSRGEGGTRRIAYYVSRRALEHGYDTCPIRSINAGHLDDIVRGMVLDHLAASGLQAEWDDAPKRDATIRELVLGVIVAPDRLDIELDAAALERCEPAPKHSHERPRACIFVPIIEQRGSVVLLSLAIRIKKLDRRRLLIAPDGQDLLARDAVTSVPEPDPSIVHAIGQAYVALRTIRDEGLSVTDAAKRLGLPRTTVTYLLPLTQLGPALLRAALEGTLPPRTTAKHLVAVGRHLDWAAQPSALARRNATR
jgi:site-specific DNA recombinase